MKQFLSITSIVVALFIASLIYYSYFNIYSDGDRIGQLIKFSLKGNIFKTYEGELLMPGSRAGSTGYQNNYLYFSVTSDSLAARIMKAQGKKIVVHYRQYRSSLPWRGDNYNDKNSDKGQYIVDKLVSATEGTQ